ncbi:Uncharacterized protein TCM_042591 isoform 2, partial [Theobroma cacao]
MIRLDDPAVSNLAASYDSKAVSRALFLHFKKHHQTKIHYVILQEMLKLRLWVPFSLCHVKSFMLLPNQMV